MVQHEQFEYVFLTVRVIESALVRPQLGPCAQKDTDLLKQVQRMSQRCSDSWSTFPLKMETGSWGSSAWRGEGLRENF